MEPHYNDDVGGHDNDLAISGFLLHQGPVA